MNEQSHLYVRHPGAGLNRFARKIENTVYEVAPNGGEIENRKRGKEVLKETRFKSSAKAKTRATTKARSSGWIISRACDLETAAEAIVTPADPSKDFADEFGCRVSSAWGALRVT
ncbi:MAG TPA: hypothetical protein VKV15_28500 [Bryobacteraceae bacterium]|nr:hypothetical protein [Bryobacteraceae bacterium]